MNYAELINDLLIDLDNEYTRLHQIWIEMPDRSRGSDILNGQAIGISKIIGLIKRKFKIEPTKSDYRDNQT